MGPCSDTRGEGLFMYTCNSALIMNSPELSAAKLKLYCPHLGTVEEEKEENHNVTTKPDSFTILLILLHNYLPITPIRFTATNLGVERQYLTCDVLTVLS